MLSKKLTGKHMDPFQWSTAEDFVASICGKAFLLVADTPSNFFLAVIKNILAH
jgi:hypothetical protein